MVHSDRAPDDGGPPAGDDPLIFVSDSSAEAELLIGALRARGYTAVDVPLALLVSRVAVQRPGLILCDVDAEGALETVHRLRDVPGGSGVDIIFIGHAGATLDDMADALFHEGSGFFGRPVDVYALLRKAEALIGPPAGPPSLTPDAWSLPQSSRRASSAPPASSRRSSRPPTRATGPRADDSTPGAEVNGRQLPHPRLSSRPASPPSSKPSQGEPGPEGPENGVEPSRQPTEPPGLPPAVPLGMGVEGESSSVGTDVRAAMSPELETLLAGAEERVDSRAASVPPRSERLSPEQEVEAVLPADVLAALDEPLEGAEEDSSEDDRGLDTGTSDHTGEETGTGGGTGVRTGHGTGGTAHGTSHGTGIATGDGTGPETGIGTGVVAGPVASSGGAPGRPAPMPSTDADAATRPPAHSPQATAGLPGASTSIAAPEIATVRGLDASTYDAVTNPGVRRLVDPVSAPPSAPQSTPPATELGTAMMQPEPHQEAGSLVSTTPPRQRRKDATSSRPPPDIPASLGVGDPVVALARAIRARFTGSVAFEDERGIRRGVFRDGDFVTAASGVDGESLAAYLAHRGDLPEEIAGQLGRRIAQFGRHAGAALIAHGHLQQDQLWPALRAHAEWIIGRSMAMTKGAASIERTVPGRLEDEPSVFGGATGAEVFVEIVRRVVPPEEALRRLGGLGARLEDGPGAGLLAECALPEGEAALVQGAGGSTVALLSERADLPEFPAVLYALRELGVLQTAGTSGSPMPRESITDDLIDDEALRSRIAQRLALVEEGDYFAVLGLSRDATGYDVRRAYTELRREFEPSHVLTARTADMLEAVETIVEVLDEAYEILRDQVRRQRYRRAIEASP